MSRLTRHLPILKWITNYRWEWFPGDFMGALTVASLYVPLSVSFALLGHSHPISGLYSFVISPLLYALLGTCPLMIVGPEAPGSLLVGTLVVLSNRGTGDSENDLVSAQIAGTVTACTGTILFIAGLSRLGYVDSVLSRPFMRGFIGAVGLNVLIEQTVTGLGLGALAKSDPKVAAGSPARKLLFILTHLSDAHRLTAILSFSSFIIVMTLRFVIIALSAILTWALNWEDQGLQVLGLIRTPENTHAIPFHWPFTFKNINSIPSLITTALLISLLGLFESSLTAKSLRKAASGGTKTVGLRLDADQELLALGASNIIGGCFLALPAFGGYGRSKLNYSTGGRTPMANIILSFLTLCCILFLLPAFYYLPRGVLAAMIAVVGVSMVEECPHDILFFVRIRAGMELALMAMVFGSTIFYSISLGMALGLGWSIVAVVMHGGWRTKITILDSASSALEVGLVGEREFAQIATLCPGVRTLLITVPAGGGGPWTFINTSDLKDRLEVVVEQYGFVASQASPSHSQYSTLVSSTHDTEPKTRTALIFDLRQCTYIDGCAVQALAEIIAEHTENHHLHHGHDHDHSDENTRIIVWESLRHEHDHHDHNHHGAVERHRDDIRHKLHRAFEHPSGNDVLFLSDINDILAALGGEEARGLGEADAEVDTDFEAEQDLER